jgi:uncharacterized protein
VAGVSRRGGWFLPESPDVVGLLRRQLHVTIEGMEAFAAWAAGDAEAARAVREREHEADDARRDLHRALRAAFVTPLEPEDLFALSRGLDRVLDQARDLVREAEVMGCAPDPPVAEMAALLLAGTREIDAAVGRLEHGDAIEPADAAIAAVRRSSVSTAPRWRSSWTRTTCARSSPAASSTGAARGSPRASSTWPSGCSTPE